MGMAAPVYYTADMVRQMPDDGNKYEVVHGELLVTPAPDLPRPGRLRPRGPARTGHPLHATRRAGPGRVVER